MVKGKDIRVRVILECTCCAQKSVNKESTGISRYITQKNRHNMPSRLELRKFCSCCCKHMIHKLGERMGLDTTPVVLAVNDGY
ncbi:hypothetical protein AAHE18_05G097700 [Arachis hypogaea]